MRTARWGIGASIILGFISISQAPAEERVRYDDYHLIRVQIRSGADLDQMHRLDAQPMADGEGLGEVEYLVPPGSMAELAGLGLSYRVIDENIQDDIDAEQQRLAGGRAGAWFDDYKTEAEINAYLDQLAGAYSHLMTKYPAGTSVQGRTIYGVTITAPNGGPTKPALCFNGTQHAREWIGPMTVMYAIERLVQGYGVDPNVTQMLDNLTFHIMVIMNPDGYVYTWQTDRLWRKNRRNNGDGTFGVDLNRNWALGWGGAGSSGNTSSLTYRGPEPFSEPETRTLRDFILERREIVAHIDFHSYGQLILHPYGYDYILPPEPDLSILSGLGEDMSDAILLTHGEYYEPGPSYGLYLAAGACTDWVYGIGGAYSWTIELRPDTAGEGGFILPPAQIIPTCEEIWQAVDVLADWADDQVATNIYLESEIPELMPPGENLDVTVEVLSIGEYTVAGSTTLHYRFNPLFAFQSLTMTDLGGGLYTAALPAPDCGDQPEFYVSAQGTESGTVTLPESAPTDTFAIEVGEILTLFHEDFESPSGWTVENSAGLTDGAWDLGIPVDCDRGDPPADFDGSGNCYLTDNSAAGGCDSDVDGGYTWLISPTLDLPDGGRVHYALWYTNNFGNDPNNDYFVVYVSNNDGATWQVAEIIGPNSLSGWNEFTFEIEEFVVPSSQIKVRFEASDLNSGSVVEAGMDDFTVWRVECTSPYGNGDFDQDGDVDAKDAGEFQACFGSTAGGVCSAGNMAGDSTIGLDDFIEFWEALTGPQ